MGWEGDKKRKGKSQEQKDERAGSSMAAALRIPPGATTRDWDISRTPRGLQCSACAASTGGHFAFSNA